MSLAEAGRFAVVGLAQNATNVAAFAGLVEAGVDYRVAAAISAAAALVMSFCLNRWWSFRVPGSASLSELVRYASVFLTATAAGIVLLSILVDIAGVPAVLAQALAIAIVAPASYLMQRTFVFKPAGPSALRPDPRRSA